MRSVSSSDDNEDEDPFAAELEDDDGFGDDYRLGQAEAEEAEASAAAEAQQHQQHAGDREEVVIHIDVDSFYVTCERIRRPDLEGKPVAVSQFNRGGFVAVSYEARARGVRKGDGIGEVGQRELSWFKDRPDAVIKEVRKRCPELVVLPMDMPWYRTVHDRIYAALEHLFPVVQRNSLDDFYVLWHPGVGEGGGGNSSSNDDDDSAYALTKLAHRPNDPPLPSSRLHPPLYAAAARVAARARRVLKETLNVSASCGIGPNKLFARLASTAAGAKPNGQGILPPDPLAIDEVLGALPLSRIPGLQQQRGDRLAAMVLEQRQKKGESGGSDGDDAAAAGVVTLLDVRRWLSRPVLVEEFGESVGAWIHAAALGRDAGKGVFTRPPPQTLIVEASFNQNRVTVALLEPLAKELLRRLLEDSGRHRRVPTSLLVRYRLDYEKVASRSTRLPRAAAALLSKQARKGGANPAAPSDNSAPQAAAAAAAVAAEALIRAALELLRKHLPPALVAAGPSSAAAAQSQQQPQQLQRLTRIVLGASGFQEAAAPQHGAITRFLGAGAGGDGGQPRRPPAAAPQSSTNSGTSAHQARSSAPATKDVVGRGKEGNAEEELPPALRAAGYDPEVWRALPPDVRREQLRLASQQQGGQRPSINKRAATPGVGSGGGGGGGKRAKQSPGNPKKGAGAAANAPLTRFFRPAGGEG